jgi:hypothetical protein
MTTYVDLLRRAAPTMLRVAIALVVICINLRVAFIIWRKSEFHD